ncbi:M24 family metallopeptidase [Brevibacillus fluminis]|uniref:M24 family metallopeptidase n=1 Tax=Brevibacillus fluminis TaxID=511487 RepID=UPI003F895F02
MTQRLEQLRESFSKHHIDGFLTDHTANRRYLSGFTGSTGTVLVSGKAAKFITDFRYIDQATEQAAGFEIVNNDRSMIKAIAAQVKELGIKRLGFEKQHVSYGTFDDWSKALEGVELVPTAGIVEEMRMIKTEQEVSMIRTAACIADDAYAHIATFIKPGISELQVAMELEFYMRKQGATSSSFDIIVASGVRGALPHGVASSKVIEKGDMVTLDFGALYKGYVSDITRTLAVGEPSDKMKEIYEIVLRAQLNGVQNIRAGMTGKEADALTRDIIEAAGYGEAYGHSTGHGIGLEVHEQPSLSKVSDMVLKPGMMVTVEPGIYVSDLGGVRIEDDVLITETGCEIITKSTKELLILPV